MTITVILLQLQDVGHIGRLASGLFDVEGRGLYFLQQHEKQVKDAVNFLAVRIVDLSSYYDIKQ